MFQPGFKVRLRFGDALRVSTLQCHMHVGQNNCLLLLLLLLLLLCWEGFGGHASSTHAPSKASNRSCCVVAPHEPRRWATQLRPAAAHQRKQCGRASSMNVVVRAGRLPQMSLCGRSVFRKFRCTGGASSVNPVVRAERLPDISLYGRSVIPIFRCTGGASSRIFVVRAERHPEFPLYGRSIAHG